MRDAMTERRGGDGGPRSIARLLSLAAGIVVTLHAGSSAAQDADEADRRALLLGLARAGMRSIADARTFLKDEGKRAADLGLGGKVRTLGRRLREAEFLEELAEVGFETTRGLIRVHSGGKAVAGRFVGIDDGVLSLKTPTGKLVTLRVAELDAASIVRYSGVAASKTGDPAKAATYYLMRGQPLAARKALGAAGDEKTRELREDIKQLAVLLLQHSPEQPGTEAGADHGAGGGGDHEVGVGFPPPSIAALREYRRLQSRDPVVRSKASCELFNLHDWGMVPTLLKATRDRSRDLRNAAINALSCLRHPSILQRLRDLAKNHPDESTRTSAVQAMEGQGRVVVPDLLEYLAKDTSPRVRRAAAASLDKWGGTEAVKALIKALENDEPYVKRAAAHSLGHLRAREAVPVLVRFLREARPGGPGGHAAASVRQEVGRECTYALGYIGDESSVPELLAALKVQPKDGRAGLLKHTLIDVVGKIGRAKVAPALRPYVNDPDTWTRRAVAVALGKLGNADSAKDLAGMLHDRIGSVRGAAREALTIIGTSDAMKALGKTVPSEQAFEGMVRRLRFGALMERIKAAREIRKYRSSAAVSALVGALEDDQPSVRGAALQSLLYCNRLWCYPAVIPLTKDPNEYVRVKAVNVARLPSDILLEIFKTDASPKVRSAAACRLGRSAIPTLLRAIDEDVAVRAAAIAALGQLQADEAAPRIIGFLNSDDRKLRTSAAYALKTLGRRSAIPALFEALRKEDLELAPNESAQAIIYALGRLQAHVALDEILRFSRSPDRLVRSSVVDALGSIGTAEVVPALAAALDDKDSGVREDAARYLREMDTGDALKALRKPRK